MRHYFTFYSMDDKALTERINIKAREGYLLHSVIVAHHILSVMYKDMPDDLTPPSDGGV